jgi:hypothetical protein
MRLTELTIAIRNAKNIFKQIKAKYPAIRAYLVLSTRFGQAPIDATLEYLLDETDHFFVENDAVNSVWRLLDQIFDATENLKQNRRTWSPQVIRDVETKIVSLQQQYKEYVPLVEIDDEVEICLRWDEIDYDINRQLGADNGLVDEGNSNTKIGGIKICLGTIKDLSTKHI